MDSPPAPVPGCCLSGKGPVGYEIMDAKNMTTEQAKQLVERLRRKAHGSTLPESDLSLLRSLAEADENLSFMLTGVCDLVLATQDGWSWGHLGLVAIAAFIMYLRWELFRLRQAIRIFEDRGAQKGYRLFRALNSVPAPALAGDGELNR